jgi:dihydroorotate dehydrogenase electron transfer subunit
MHDARMHTYRVQRVVEHAPQLKSFFLEVPFAADPGQFVDLWIPGVDEKPFSISDLQGTTLELSIKAVGVFTSRMMDVKVGDWLGVRGPFGHGFRTEEDSLLVGGGIGFAPLRFLARRLKEQGLRHRVAIGVRSKADLIFLDDLKGCALASEDGSIGEHGRVTQLVERMLDEAMPKLVCAAGPEAMLLAVGEVARRRGVPAQLCMERYMKCGVGICGQCCLDGPGLRVCVEGPVFDARDLEGVTELGKPHRAASGKRPDTG